MESESHRLAEAIVVLADTLVDEFDVADLLHELTTRSVDLVGADAAGLVLSDGHGSLRVLASSSELAALMELFQLQQEEGPCLDCYRSGRQVDEADLAGADGRWPSFAPRAVDAGYRSVHALPLRLHGEVLGALNLFSRRPRAASPDQLRLAQALADLATISLVQVRRAQEREELTAQLQHALDSRVMIERATGLIAGRTGRDLDEAFAVLRAAARRARRRLPDVAHEVVTGRTNLDSPC